MFEPLHNFPPHDGVGLLQSLNFSLIPPPHVTEQPPTFQPDQLPSTKQKIIWTYLGSSECYEIKIDISYS